MARRIFQIVCGAKADKNIGLEKGELGFATCADKGFYIGTNGTQAGEIRFPNQQDMNAAIEAGLNDKGIPSRGSISNLNNAVNTGTHLIGTISEITNAPEAFCIIVVFNTENKYIAQLAFAVVTGTVYSRSRSDSNVWTEWKKISFS